jgi:hypothetical protein
MLLNRKILLKHIIMRFREDLPATDAGTQTARSARTLLAPFFGVKIKIHVIH